MPPLRVEYAKSGRSRCCLKECNKFIDKGEVRVGTGVMMPGMEDPSFKWRHLCCFTARQAKNAGGSVDHIEGFEDLTPVDQALVAKMMRGELVGDHSILGKTGTAGTASNVPEAAAAKKSPKKPKPVVAAGAPNVAPNTTTAPRKAGGVGAGGKKRQRTDEDDCASDATDEYEVYDLGGTETTAVPKPLCPYGPACFRKNPAHFVEYRHGDEGVSSSCETVSSVAIGARRKDGVKPTPEAKPAVAAPEEARSTQPPTVAASPIPSTAQVPTGQQRKCPHGALCFRTDAKHFIDMLH